MADPNSYSHAELVEAGCKWLRRQSCSVIVHEPFRCSINEQPDAIGWREGASILLEAKASRSDYLVDARKPWRREPALGVGDWRFFIAPLGMISVDELPDRWGLLELKGRRVLATHGVPGNIGWYRSAFPEANKRNEIQLLISAVGSPGVKPRPEIPLRRGIDIHAWREHLEEPCG